MKLRDWVEIIIIVVGVILYVSGGFQGNKATSEQMERQITEHDKAIVQLQTLIQRIDDAGTRRSQGVDLGQAKDIAENTRRLEVLEGNYKAVYDLLITIRNSKK
jgi:hypothetical protein